MQAQMLARVQMQPQTSSPAAAARVRQHPTPDAAPLHTARDPHGCHLVLRDGRMLDGCTVA